MGNKKRWPAQSHTPIGSEGLAQQEEALGTAEPREDSPLAGESHVSHTIGPQSMWAELIRNIRNSKPRHAAETSSLPIGVWGCYTSGEVKRCQEQEPVTPGMPLGTSRAPGSGLLAVPPTKYRVCIKILQTC